MKDEQFYKAVAEAVVNGYIDEFGNRKKPISQIVSQWKPDEAFMKFMKQIEEKIDMDLMASEIIKKFTQFSSYDSEVIGKEVKAKVIEKIATKQAEKYLEDNK